MRGDFSSILCLNSLVFIVTFFLLISNLCFILVTIWEPMVSQEIPFIFSFLVKMTVGISIASHLDFLCVV